MPCLILILRPHVLLSVPVSSCTFFYCFLWCYFYHTFIPGTKAKKCCNCISLILFNIFYCFQIVYRIAVEIFSCFFFFYFGLFFSELFHIFSGLLNFVLNIVHYWFCFLVPSDQSFHFILWYRNDMRADADCYQWLVI